MPVTSGNVGAELLGPLFVVGTGAEQVDEHAAGVAHGVENPAQAALVRVLDDDAGAGQEIGAHVGVDAAGVGGGDRGAGVVQPAGQRPALDDQLEFHPPAEHRVQQAADEFGLTDRQTPH